MNKARAQWDGHCAQVDGDGRGRVALFSSVIVEQVFGFEGFLVNRFVVNGLLRKTDERIGTDLLDFEK